VGIDLEEVTAAWPLRTVVETGQTVNVNDLTRKFGALPSGGWPETPERAVVLPVKKPGQAQLAGFVVAGISPRLVLNDEYRGFLELLAGHVAAAVANAQAHEEEQRRAEALAELDRAKTAFFSNVSHEFRTPLTLMLGPVADLLVKSHTDLSPAAASQLEVVHRNGLRLLRLVNTLLDFSRIEAGRVRAAYQPTDLAAFTADLASVFRAAIERAGLRLQVDCPPLREPVYVDRDMWEKIVLNLLSNAFKFTFEGEIAVTLRECEGAHHAERDGYLADRDGYFPGCVELEVRDTGTGIAAGEMPRLFERFHRIENARGRTHEGSGIGLALVQELVKLHGGTISAASVLGSGTTITIRMPLGTAHLPGDQIRDEPIVTTPVRGASPYVEEALRWLPDLEVSGEEPEVRDSLLAGLSTLTTTPEMPAEANGRARVLVADDNSDMRQYLVRLLADRYHVEAAADGAAALAAARQRPPDLVLTDVMMPQLDGFGLLRELRGNESTRTVPVMLLSARAGEEAQVEGLEAGADDYLIKPFSARELLARVGSHLELARLRWEAADALRESEARFRHLADHAPVMIWITDPFGSSTYLSAQWYQFTGTSAREGEGFGWIDSVHPDDREKARESFLAANERREPLRLEYRLRRHDGEYRWALDTGVPRFGAGGEFFGYIGSVIDITERKRDEVALHDADRRKDEFLAMLAHELRGPLAPLRNMLEIMKRAEGNSGLMQQAQHTMERQLRQLVRLVDDLLDVSRITRNKLELRRQRVELAPILHQAIEACQPLAKEFQHQVKLTLPPQPIELHADPERLTQVFSNLVNNACKYTNPDGKIEVTAEVRGQESGVREPEVVVTVTDTGLGIPRDQLGSIFEMFTQVDRSLERAQGGLGIGLTLVKRLVEMHGGTVEARSEGPGRGSAFVVRLPILAAAEEATPVEPPRAGSRGTSRRRILVVDDNQDSAESLAMLLGLTGHETRTAYDGLAALEAAEQFRPEVMLLDLGLPKVNGFDAARRIREQPWGQGMVLIALTGWGQEADRRRSKEAGFDAHQVKPVDPAALVKLLESFQVSR
jgi:PAS domain S-box-containing protein